MTATFFGYGSLVNQKSHREPYENFRKAETTGWVRTWRQDTHWPAAILTAVPAPGVTLLGITADVPNGDWAELDKRERGYDRIMLQNTETAIYTIPEGRHAELATPHRIWLSYLDIVVQGYLALYGPSGVQHFFDTTTRWDTPIADDRHDPLYARADRSLTPTDYAMTDAHLIRLSARVEQL